MKRYLTETLCVILALLPVWVVVELTHTPKPRNIVQVFPIKEVEITVLPLKSTLLYKTSEQVNLTAKERDCLVKNIYHEAGVEDFEGKIAVAQITLNRVKHGQWGKDVCKVVYAKAQFSWTMDKRKRNAQPKGPLWEASQSAADQFIKGIRITRLDQSLHYHADYVNPNWADQDRMIKQIGAHIFYALK